MIEKTDGKAQYIIIGPDPVEEGWKLLSESTGGAARAIGYIPREEAYAIISMADFYVPGFPLVSGGANVAEQYGIPYMALGITEWAQRAYPGKTVESVEELAVCIVKGLNGDSEEFKKKSDNRVLDREDWVNEWKKIDESACSHAVQAIHPNKCLGKEEIINLQLLEESPYYKSFCSSIDISDDLYRKLYEIGKMHGVSIVPENNVSPGRVGSMDLFCFKNMKLFNYTSKWLRLENKGIHITDYLRSKGYDNVSIHGMGVMGKNLYELLLNSECRIDCIIDCNAKKYEGDISYGGVRVINPDEAYDINSKVIISTAVTDASVIKRDYALMPHKIQVMSIFDIIDDMEGDRD